MKNKKIIVALCAGEFVERFCFYGILSMLVLQLKSYYGMETKAALAIFGTFITLSYAGIIIGGVVTDKLIGTKSSIKLGLLFLVVGYFLVGNHTIALFYFGLTLVIIGTSLYKVSSAAKVSQYNSDNLALNEKILSYYYISMNAGAVLGPLVLGVVSQYLTLHTTFIFCSVAVAIFLSGLVRVLALMPEEGKCIFTLPRKLLGAFVFVALGLFIILCFTHAKVTVEFLVVVLVALAVGLIRAVSKGTRENNRKLFYIVILLLGCVLFFSLSLQVTGSVTLFIHSVLSRKVLGVNVPVEAFTSLDPLFVIMMSPVFIIIWKKLEGYSFHAIMKTAIGVILAAISFYFLHLSARYYQTPYALIYLVLFYFFIGSGEIAFTPAILAALSKYVPSHLKSTAFGGWYLSVSIGGYTAAAISSLISAGSVHALDQRAILASRYDNEFLFIAILGMLAGLCYVFFRKVESSVIS